jgi:two-component system sensor histidine kinase UhpB
LIALEALHNAARHSKARSVVLGVRPLGRKWQLWVSDDGIGLQTSDENQNGLGLKSMKRRAEEIDADIIWSSENDRGTTVTVTFHPQARERRFK